MYDDYGFRQPVTADDNICWASIPPHSTRLMVHGETRIALVKGFYRR